MTPKLAIFLAIPLLFVGSLLSAKYVVVDVREGGPQGHHIWIPVPMALAQMALSFAPAEAREVEAPPEAAQYLPAARRLVDELAKAPDGALVEVEDHATRVSIVKLGSVIKIHVEDGDDRVDVAFPLGAAQDALAGFDGKRFKTATLLAAVARNAHGDLVHVRDGEDEVRIRVW